MYYKRPKSNVKGQGHGVKMSFHRQIIAPSYVIGVAESNGDVRILMRSPEIAI